MKIKIELCKLEIEAIIAEKYGIDPRDVSLKVENRPTGYGIGETIEHCPVAKIETNNSNAARLMGQIVTEPLKEDK